MSPSGATSARPRVSVPFVDLAPSNQPLKEAILAEIESLIDASAYVNGPQVGAFEQAFAGFVGVPHCVGVSSGTDALRLALMAVDLLPGDEVVVPANTFIATVEAVVQAGGRPVVADVSETDYNLDPAVVEAVVGPRTRALLPVHLYGQLAQMTRLAALAESRQLTIIEDACQAHGAKRDDLTAGAVGRAAAFSFYPGKNLGAIGDAGAVVTSDPEIAARVRSLRDHGQREKYRHDVLGYTARLDSVQALVLLRKLPSLDAWNTERAATARYYAESLAGVGDLVLPPVPPGSRPVWHLYVVRTGRSNELRAFLGDLGIATGRHYPVPVHLTPACAYLGHAEGSFPVAEVLSRELVSLPIYPGISEPQLDAVVRGVRSFFASSESVRA